MQSDASDEYLEGPDDDDWLIVPKWDTFQHYGDRNPPWIKLYTKLLADPDYLDLTLTERGLLTTIWIAYASNNGQLNVKQLSSCCRARYGMPQLVSLNHAGFLHFSASKPLAAKKEKEKEKESPNPLTGRTVENELLSAAINVAADWNGGDSLEFDKRLEVLEQMFHRQLTPSQRDKLWDEALKRDNGLF